MKEKLEHLKDEMQTSMHTNPMRWAGIATGTGLTLGLLGRFLRSRSAKRRGAQPDLVIIDGSC